MNTEIEAKFLAVDHDAIRAKLRELGATCEQPMRLMRRKTYDFASKPLQDKHGWVRVRDEGDKITMSYKQLNDRTAHGTKEVNLVIDTFDAGDQFLQAIGLVRKSYQETKRESWTLHDVQIELDEWPWIQPLIEIEGPSEQVVRDVATNLGFNWNAALHGSVENAYQAEYDVTEADVDGWTEILFTAVPDTLAAKRKASA